MTTELARTEVDFDVWKVALRRKTADELPVSVAVAVVNQFTEHTVTASDGEQSDRDVLFRDHGLLVEEKAVGVCRREVAERHAPVVINPERRDGLVLAINPGQIFEDYR